MRQKVILICEECLSRNYTVDKNKLTNPERMVIKKGDALKLLEDYKGQTVNLMGKTCHTLENIINE